MRNDDDFPAAEFDRWKTDAPERVTLVERCTGCGNLKDDGLVCNLGEVHCGSCMGTDWEEVADHEG